jgi:hypothetical protein
MIKETTESSEPNTLAFFLGAQITQKTSECSEANTLAYFLQAQRTKKTTIKHRVSYS